MLKRSKPAVTAFLGTHEINRVRDTYRLHERVSPENRCTRQDKYDTRILREGVPALHSRV